MARDPQNTGGISDEMITILRSCFREASVVRRENFVAAAREPQSIIKNQYQTIRLYRCFKSNNTIEDEYNS